MTKKDNENKDRHFEKTEFGDIVKDTSLIKRTLMVSAFPALVKESEENGKKIFSGYLPGFEFSEVEDAKDIGDCTQQLQDLLDDNVEELVVFGKQLPNLPDDETLLKNNPGYKIMYLDINVYAYPDDLEEWDECCDDDCDCCSGGCHHDDCCDDDCDCHHTDEHKCNCDHENEHKCNCNHDGHNCQNNGDKKCTGKHNCKK